MVRRQHRTFNPNNFTYGKIFAQIFDSSIADDYHLRHFFMDLIVLADSDGVVNMTPTAIAARTRMPLESVISLLERLQSPDPLSQTPDADGRRIELLDEHRPWGWHIINYQKYRDFATEEQRKLKTRERVRRFKLKRKQLQEGNAEVTLGNAEVTPPYVSHSPYASSSKGEGIGERNFPEVSIPSLDEALIYAQKIGLPEWKARDTFEKLNCTGWKDKHGNPISCWQSFFNRVRTWWEADGRPAAQAASGNGAKSAFEIKTIIQAKEALAGQIKSVHCAETGLSERWDKAEQRKKYFQLRKEIKDLNHQLSAMG